MMCVSQQSSADFQYGQTVKSHFAVQSSDQAVKVTVNFLTLVLTAAVDTVLMGVTTPCWKCEP